MNIFQTALSSKWSLSSTFSYNWIWTSFLQLPHYITLRGVIPVVYIRLIGRELYSQ
jgi:hypothetical protein